MPKVKIDLIHVDADPKGAKSQRLPKFRDPANPFQTWSGYGPRPRWLKRYLDEGADIEFFRIRDADDD